jgi:F-type H+-transporting ATPase subunit b
MERAEEVRRQAEQAEADRQSLLAEMRREAEQIRSRADEQAKRIISEAQVTAQDQANRIKERADADLVASRQQMMAEIRTQVADLVVAAVDRVTRQALDGSSQQRLIQQFLQGEAAGSAARASR